MADGLSQLGIPANSNLPEKRSDLPDTHVPPDLSQAAERIQPHHPLLNRPLMGAGLRAFDFLVSAFAAWLALTLSGHDPLGSSVATVLPFFLLPVVISWGLRNAEVYKLRYSRPVMDHMMRTGIGAGLPVVALVLLVAVFWPGPTLRWLAGAGYLAFTCVMILHAHTIVGFKVLTRKGAFSENVILVGATPNAQQLLARNSKTHDLNVVGVFDDRLSRSPRTIEGVPVLGQVDDLLNWERLPEIDRIIVTVTSGARSRVRQLVDRLRVLPQRVVLLLDLDGFDPETESLAEIARSPAAYVSGHPDNLRRATIKRLSDILLASLMLILFSPLFLVTAIAIKLDSRGPVFFRQRRHGFNNQIIRVWKFRSMRHNPEAEERMSAQTVHKDPRVTRVGRLIRATSIDELPQLVNVLSGEMSVVGPRPHAVGMTTEDAEVQGLVSDYAHRHRVKPGITGWAQVNGSRGPVHTREEVRERIRLDMEYVNRSSLWFDLYIILITAPCLLGDWQRHR